MKKKLLITASCLFSAALLLAIASSLDWALFLKEIKKVNALILVPYLALFYLCYLTRALRWRYLLPKTEPKIPTRDLIEASILGFFATNILPLRAGEFIRPLVLSKWSGISFTKCFASVVSERVFDVLALLCFLGISMQFVQARHPLIYLGAQALSILALLILTLMLLSYFQEARILKLLRYILRTLFGERAIGEKILALSKDFIAGLKSIRSLRDLSCVALYSLLLWGLTALIYQVFLWSFSLYPSFNVGMILSLMIAFAVAAPSAPGFLGTFQFGCIVALSVLYPYSKEFAVAYSIVSLGLQFLLTNLAGLLVLKRRGLKLSALQKDN